MVDNIDLVHMSGSRSETNNGDVEMIKEPKRSHIPRPRNAFILFRSYKQKLLTDYWKKSGQDIPHNCEVSKIISLQWRKLSAEDKEEWHRKAEQEKHEHAKKYPGYKYKPKRKKNKNKLDLKFEPHNLVQVYPQHAGQSTGESLLVPDLNRHNTSVFPSTASVLPPIGGRPDDQMHYQQQVGPVSAGSQTSNAYLMQLAPWEDRYASDQQAQQQQRRKQQQSNGVARGPDSNPASQLTSINLSNLSNTTTPKVAYQHDSIWKLPAYRLQQNFQQSTVQTQFRYAQQQSAQPQHSQSYRYHQQHLQQSTAPTQFCYPQQAQQQSAQPQPAQPQHSQSYRYHQQPPMQQQHYYRLPNLQQESYLDYSFQQPVALSSPTSVQQNSSNSLLSETANTQSLPYPMYPHQSPQDDPSLLNNSFPLHSNMEKPSNPFPKLDSTQPDDINPNK